MQRRTFLQWSAAAPAAFANVTGDIPKYKSVSSYKPHPQKGFPASVVSVHSAKSIDEATEKVDPQVVRQMMERGMTALTGESTVTAAWKRFISPSDVVGIKVNCSGAPRIKSHPVVVADIVRNLLAVGVKADQIYIYERFPDQLESVKYGEFLDQKVNIYAVEMSRGSVLNYDPNTYVEVNFFGEEDTRSNLIRLVSEKFTKIINVPNMKDHGAAGVTGCLKNIAYGNYSNVARSHANEKTNTKTFIATLASLEPLRSKTVLNIMDGLKGVWHGGPFLLNPKFGFFPKKMMFGTDMVAMDRLLIDVIENKRKEEHARSVWDRSRDQLITSRSTDPNKNQFIREPGHIEYAAGLGLGEYDIKKIKLKEFEV
jgi:uncharacterized protein (DUF362 family)